MPRKRSRDQIAAEWLEDVGMRIDCEVLEIASPTIAAGVELEWFGGKFLPRYAEFLERQRAERLEFMRDAKPIPSTSKSFLELSRAEEEASQTDDSPRLSSRVRDLGVLMAQYEEQGERLIKELRTYQAKTTGSKTREKDIGINFSASWVAYFVLKARGSTDDLARLVLECLERHGHDFSYIDKDNRQTAMRARLHRLGIL